MEINKLKLGIDILVKYAKFAELDNIKDSYSNGTPAHSHRSYIMIEVESDVSKEDSMMLKKNGWRAEYGFDLEEQYWYLNDS